MCFSIEEQKILQYAMQNGIIDLADVSADVESMKRQEILEKYHYWQGTDGRFYFKYKDKISGKKKKISRASEQDIQEVILKFHAETAEKHTLVTTFEEWITEKIVCGELQESSVIKYKNNAKRFWAADRELAVNTDVKLLNDDMMEIYVKKTIHDLKLTSKGYSDFRTILMGVLKYAKRKKYTTYSIAAFFLDFVPGKNALTRTKSKSGTSCFKKSELKKLKNKLLENGTVRDLALLLQMYTGLRVGELTTLKSCDNVEKNKLLIRRTESSAIDPEKKCRITKIKETAKTDASDREMILTTE